jgi:NADH dehydrogenase (ubiquinone) Fe-S protein 1
LEDYSVRLFLLDALQTISNSLLSALSEVLGSPLPYDDVLSLRDRLWEISPTLVRYDTTEPTSVDVALAGLKTLAAKTAGAKVTGTVFQKPISNFYQTDPISRA